MKTRFALKLFTGVLSTFFSMAFAMGTMSNAAVYAAPNVNKDEFAYYLSMNKDAIDHSVFAAFLTKYATTGTGTGTGDQAGVNLVDYKNVTAADKAALKSYIQSLESLDPTQYTEDEGFAYWVNLYNAVTINVILDYYPVASIKDIRFGLRPGPWKQDFVTVNGQSLSLDNIEHDILRGTWQDPRIHYAVNCASISCPNLALKPYSGANLNAELDQAARDYINHDRAVWFDGDNLEVSTIFRWYRKDFGSNDRDVIAHLRRYADDDLRAKLNGVSRIRGYDYNWSLNETP